MRRSRLKRPYASIPRQYDQGTGSFPIAATPRQHHAGAHRGGQHAVWNPARSGGALDGQPHGGLRRHALAAGRGGIGPRRRRHPHRARTGLRTKPDFRHPPACLLACGRLKFTEVLRIRDAVTPDSASSLAGECPIMTRSLAIRGWMFTSALVLGLPVPSLTAAAPPNIYVQQNLVANVAGQAAFTDPNLLDPWGIALSTSSPFWVSNHLSGTSTLYSGNGAITAVVVTIPPSKGSKVSFGRPTGQVQNAS